MSNWKTAAEIEPKETISGIIYGDVGIGKTTMALSAPYPALFDIEKGLDRVQQKHFAIDTPIVQSENWDELNLDVKTMPKERETIVIDSMAKSLEMLIDDICIKFPNLLQRDGTPSQKAYGQRKKLFKEFMKSIKCKDKNLIFICHEEFEDNGDGTFKKTPALGTKNQNFLGLIVDDLDFIGYMSMTGKRRTIAFNNTSQYRGKNSIGLDEFITVPTLEDNEHNTFLTDYIIKPTIAHRKAEKAEAKKQLQLIEQGKLLISQSKDPNKTLDEFKKMELGVYAKTLLFKELCASTDMTFKDGRFE